MLTRGLRAGKVSVTLTIGCAIPSPRSVRMYVSLGLVVVAVSVPSPAVRQPSVFVAVLRHIVRLPIGLTLDTSALTLPVAPFQVMIRSAPSGLSAASTNSWASVIVAFGAGLGVGLASSLGVASSVGVASVDGSSVGASSVGSSAPSGAPVTAVLGDGRGPAVHG